MRAVVVTIPLLLAIAGCVTPPVQPTELPEVTSGDYDLLWEATRQTAQEHFDLFVQRKDEGYIVSAYKRAEPLPGPLKRDAQSGYDAAEEFMHIVRRRLTARVFEQRKGVYAVKLEVIRERQGFVPARPDFAAPHNLYDPQKTALDDAADQSETVTWQPLGRDRLLEQRLLSRIQSTLSRQRAPQTQTPPAAPKTPDKEKERQGNTG